MLLIKRRYDALFWLLLAGLVLLLVQGMLINVGDTKEVFLHANVILSLLFAKTITKDKDVEFKVPYVLIWVYMIVSFILYLFYWEPIAIMVSSQYYEGDDIFLSVRTNGFNRSFGLLFNILANGYFLLLIFFITNALHRTKFSLFKIILIFSIASTITRGAIVPMVLFLFLNSIYEKRWALLAAIFLIFTVVYHLFTPATLVVDSILKMEDSQGSAQMHQSNVIDALTIILDNPIGIGFK